MELEKKLLRHSLTLWIALLALALGISGTARPAPMVTKLETVFAQSPHVVAAQIVSPAKYGFVKIEIFEVLAGSLPEGVMAVRYEEDRIPRVRERVRLIAFLDSSLTWNYMAGSTEAGDSNFAGPLQVILFPHLPEQGPTCIPDREWFRAAGA